MDSNKTRLDLNKQLDSKVFFFDCKFCYKKEIKWNLHFDPLRGFRPICELLFWFWSLGLDGADNTSIEEESRLPRLSRLSRLPVNIIYLICSSFSFYFYWYCDDKWVKWMMRLMMNFKLLFKQRTGRVLHRMNRHESYILIHDD